MPPFIYPKLSKLKSTMIIYLEKKESSLVGNKEEINQSLQLCAIAF